MGDGSGLRLGLSLGLGSFGTDDDNNQSSKNPQPSQASSSHHNVTTTPTVPFPLNLFKSPLPHFIMQDNNNNNKSQRSSGDAFHAPTTDLNKEPRSIFRGIDMNQSAATVTDSQEDQNLIIVSSPNSTVSSQLSGKRSERDDGERDSSSLELEDDGGDGAARKKLRLSKEQAAVLEETFKEHNTLNPKQKMALAKQLNLMPRQVEVWFQNRRARTKLKQTEVDCEYLRRCCENLTEENRRLQKEVSELRALKLSPQFYMNMSPPTTLTMCPQCERVAVSSSSASSATTGQSTIAACSRNHHQRPVGMNPWAAIISPQSIDARRPRT